MSKALSAEEKAAKKAEKETVDVTVSFEGGQERTYTGPDAEAKAKEFVAKKPNERKIV